MAKKTVADIDVAGKRALVRVDFNVPLNKDGVIADDMRIKACLPTIKYLLDKKASIILCSHIGRPEGQVVEDMRMAPVAKRLSELLGMPVKTTMDCVGPEVEAAAAALKPGEILMLENLRFHKEETKNDQQFAKQLAGLADVFVNDAFGVSHRAHASVVGVTQYLPSVAGFLLAKEIKMLGESLMENPARPFAAIIGGAKISDKLAVLNNIVERVDALLIGGGMAATFLKAKGYEVGASPVEIASIPSVGKLFAQAKARGGKIMLPSDVIVTPKIEPGASAIHVSVKEIPRDYFIADIGPETVGNYAQELRQCWTVLWNGPMGVFEIKQFSEGTRGIAKVLAQLKATRVVGGGSTAEAVEEMGLTNKMTHVSTGGGASLEFLEGKSLPGIVALEDVGNSRKTVQAATDSSRH